MRFSLHFGLSLILRVLHIVSASLPACGVYLYSVPQVDLVVTEDARVAALRIALILVHLAVRLQCSIALVFLNRMSISGVQVSHAELVPLLEAR